MVCVLLGNGFEESEVIVPVDLLRRAGAEVVLTALEGIEATGAHGITLKADKPLKEIDPAAAEMLFLPGGWDGVQAIKSCPAALDLIRSSHEAGKYLAAICAAPTILGMLGLLNGRRAVCYPGLEDGLTGATVCRGTSVVEDGRIITSKAAGSAFPFGLKLVELLKGAETARQVKDEVYYHG